MYIASNDRTFRMKEELSLAASELTIEELKAVEITLGTPVTPLTLHRIASGYSNDNYVLTTDQGSYRLRVPRRANLFDQLSAEQAIVNWAADSGAVVVPLLQLLTLRGGMNVSIFPFLEADRRFDTRNERLLFNAGKALADYHLAVEEFTGELPWKPLSESFHLDAIDMGTLIARVNEQADSEYPELQQAVDKLLHRVSKIDRLLNEEPYSSLPRLPCHGDYAPANLLTTDDQVAGIIDFECCRYAPRLYDLATFVLALQEGDEYEATMKSRFLQGYRSVIALSEIELESMTFFQQIRSVEAARRHMLQVNRGDHPLHAGLIMYWDRMTSEIDRR